MIKVIIQYVLDKTIKSGKKPNSFVLRTRALIKVGSKFPHEHRCRCLLFSRFTFTVDIYDSLIREINGFDKLVLVMEKKIMIYCFKLFFEYLDEIISKRIKLQKAGRQDSIDGCGAKKVHSFSRFVYVFLDGVFFHLIDHSEGERRTKFISLQRRWFLFYRRINDEVFSLMILENKNKSKSLKVSNSFALVYIILCVFCILLIYARQKT